MCRIQLSLTILCAQDEEKAEASVSSYSFNQCLLNTNQSSSVRLLKRKCLIMYKSLTEYMYFDFIIKRNN